MVGKQRTFVATAVIVAGITAAAAALAQAPGTAPRPPESQGMMKGQGGMMGMMGQMDPDHMRRMAQMMDNCNRMMQRTNGGTSDAPGGSPPATRQ